MRIGLVCPYSLTIPGGVQGQVLGLARSLRALGHHTRVLAPCDGPPPDAGVTPLGRSVPLASNGSVAPLAPDPSAALRTIRALRDEEFDIVHIHEPFAPGPALTAMLFADAPIVATFHRSGGSSLYTAFAPIVRRMARRLTARVAVSEDARKTAVEAMGGEYELLFNGIEIERFAKGAPTPTDGPTVLFLNRHEPRKGLAVLVAAAAHLGPDVRFWIGSDGPQTDELRAQTADDPRFSWLGRIDDDERAARLQGADVFCAPSLGGESFGLVLLEAMAASTPIVASQIPGYARVARDGVEAVLAAPDDPVALAAGLDRVLRDRSLAAALVAAGESRAREFAMDRLAEQYVALYERVRR